MNLLALNFEIQNRMRTQPQIALGVLPLGLLFSSFAPLFFFGAWLSSVLGIPEGAPIRDQPHGGIWIVVFLSVMVFLMVSGFSLGWVVNGLFLRFFFKWPKDKVFRTLLHSEVPRSWLKEIDSESASHSLTSQEQNWQETRKKGKLRFVFRRGVLAWGLPMYLFMAGLPAINGKVVPTPFYFLWQAGLWGFAGAVFGLAFWYFSERSFLKQRDSDESQH